MSVVPDRRWNRNIHYHDVVLGAVPPQCGRALDVGCGAGRLASELAERCGEVTGIDADPPALALARSRYPRPNLSFVEGDAMSHAFPDASFDFIASIATLHHLPLEPALERFGLLLRPGGVLTIIGLYRLSTLSDFIYGCVAKPVSGWLYITRGGEPVAAPTRDPDETLREIRAGVEKVLPGADFERRLLFRYSLIWKKPPA
jgi:SAM-dependent methyltransferase